MRKSTGVRAAQQSLCCLLSFLLAFSLLGTSFPAWADEPSAEEAAATAQDARGTPASEAAALPAQDAPTQQSGTVEEDGGPEGTRPLAASTGITEAPVEPATPVDYYEEPEPEGRLVSVEDDREIYQLSATRLRVTVGGVATAFENENGRPTPIDNTLVPTDDGKLPKTTEGAPLAQAAHPTVYEPKANSFALQIPERLAAGQGIVIEKDGHRIELVPESGDFTHAAVEGNAIRFTEVRPGVDYQYTLVGSMVKEDIVLTRPADSFVPATRLELPNDLEAVERDGLIVVREKNTSGGGAGDDPENVVLTLTAPMATDAAEAIDNSLSLSLTRAEDGTPVAQVNANWDWLNAAERAFPIRIDPTVDLSKKRLRVTAVEQNAPNTYIGENNFHGAGYDDGVKTGSAALRGGEGLGMLRLYIDVNYDFAAKIKDDWCIDKATLQLHQRTAFSKGKTKFGLYRNKKTWDFDTVTWNKQKSMTHELVQFKTAKKTAGYLTWNIREVVNNWGNGLWKQHGFCVKASDERNMQCEIFDNRSSDNPPQLVFEYSKVPTEVDNGVSLDGTTIHARTVTESDSSGKLRLDGVFADGVAKSNATVAYELSPSGAKGTTTAATTYKYPNSSDWEAAYPKGTKYRDKVSNWQSPLFNGLTPNVKYQISATASHDGTTGKTVKSDTFVVYKATALDTLPSIARHYGVTLNTLAKDNRVQDTLVVAGNLLFIRNPKTTKPYRTKNLTDTQKRRIDSALMGRDKHCEYGFEPINLNTGNFILEATDATVPELEGDFALKRTYNAQGEGELSPFGRNWSFPWDESLAMQENGSVVYAAGDGKLFWFDPDGSGSFSPHADTGMSLKRIAYDEGDDTFYRWEITGRNGSVRQFDKWGRLSATVTAKGLATSIGRDGAGNVSEVVSPTGVHYRFTCNSDGLITAVQLPGGGRLSYGYDASGNLTSHTDANGNRVRYEYDAQGRMTAWYDQNGKRVVQNTYDAANRVTRQLDLAGRASILSYGAGTTRATDAAGRTTTYRYDAYGRTVGITYPDGTAVQRAYGANDTLVADENGTYAYDARGNLVKSTARGGQVTSWTYDAANRVTSQTDPDGAVTAYAYDGKGNLTKSSSPARGTTLYTYDGLGRLTSETDADGVRVEYGWNGALIASVATASGTTRYSYDAMGRPTAVTDPAGHTTRTFYDAAGRQTGEQDATGATTTYTLDATGFMTSLTEPTGAVSRFTYDSAYNIASMTDPLGGVTRYAYDAAGNKTAETGPDGARQTWAYDARDRLIRCTDARGATTSYTYDDRGNVASVTDPLGATESAEYDKTYGVATRMVDARGNATALTYDAAGRLVRASFPDGASQTSAYAAGGRLLSDTDERGATTEYTYTAAGRVSAASTEGRTWSFSYDGAGNATGVADPSGRRYQLAYDARGNLVSLRDEEGTLAAWAYDAAGRTVRETDALGAATSYRYDALGNLLQQTDPLGATTTYTYDALGDVASITDSRGNTTRYAYDAAGNLSSITDAEGHRRTALWDAAGNLVEERDAEGHATSYAYDPAGNLTTLTRPDGSRETYEYDESGNLVRATDAAGLETRYAYDVAGNLVGADESSGVSEIYEYDEGGNLTAAIDALGRRASWSYDPWGDVVAETGTDGATTTYERDGAGRVVRETDALGHATAYAYDARSNIISETREADGAVTAYAYDAAGQLTALTDALGAVSSWAYDAAGNVTSQTDPEGNTTAFEYDGEGNLVASTDPLGNRSTYEWDAQGNLSASVTPEGSRDSYAYDGEGQPVSHTDPLGHQERWRWDELGNLASHTDLSGATTTFAYDAHGNLVRETDALGNATTYENDLRGNVTALVRPSGARWEYSWDALDRLTKVRTPRGYVRELTYDETGNAVGETDNLGARATYAYDALHRMVQARDGAALTSGSAARAVERRWEYDAAGNLTAETDGTGARTAYRYDAAGNLLERLSADGAKAQWTWDANGNPLTQAGTGIEPRSWTWDAAGNMATETDGRGNVTRYRYDGDGNLVQTKSPQGAETNYLWDKGGNLAAVVDSLGNTARWEYDPMGRATAAIDRRGERTEYRYDALGQLTRVTEPSGATCAYAYDVDGNLSHMTDALGRVTAYAYDAEGDLASVTSPSGAVESFVRDPAGRVTAVTDSAGKTTHYNWDELGNLVEKSYGDPGAQPVVYAYDAEGRVTSRSDAAGDATYAYDDLGRVAAETDGAGNRIGYAYDEQGNLARINYPNGGRVTYAYDEEGNLTGVTTAEGTYVYDYDEENRPVALSRPDGTATAYAYDSEGQLVRLTHTAADGTVLSSFEYAYDEEGNPVAEAAATTQSDGCRQTASRTFSYNADGRLASFSEVVEEDEGSKAEHASEAYGWDAAGNRTSLDRRGDRPEHIEFRYDEDNRLIESDSSVAGRTTYAYDDAGNLVAKTGEDQAAVEYAWDVENRLTAVRQGGRVLLAATYDGDGNRIFQASLYHTDEVDRFGVPAIALEGRPNLPPLVAKQTAAEPTEQAGQADENPSPSSPDRADNRQTGAAGNEGAPDALDARIAFSPIELRTGSRTATATSPEPFVRSATMIAAAALTVFNPVLGLTALRATELLFAPKAASEKAPLVAIPFPTRTATAFASAGLVPEEVLKMAMDAPARPLENAATSQDDGERTIRSLSSPTLQPSEPVAEPTHKLRQSGVIPVEHPYVQDRWELVAYVNSTVVDDVPQPLLRESSTAGELADVYGLGRLATAGGAAQAPVVATYLEDGQGSVAAVLDSAGSVSAAYRYSPWGEAAGDAGEMPSYGYNAEETVPAAGLQYLRARWYSAADGAFQSPDTYLGSAEDPSTLNRYAYASGNPLAYADPTGHESRSTRGETKAWLDRSRDARQNLSWNSRRSSVGTTSVAARGPRPGMMSPSSAMTPQLRKAASRRTAFATPTVLNRRPSSTSHRPSSHSATRSTARSTTHSSTYRSGAAGAQHAAAASAPRQTRYARAQIHREHVVEHFCSTAPTTGAPGRRNGGDALWSYQMGAKTAWEAASWALAPEAKIAGTAAKGLAILSGAAKGARAVEGATKAAAAASKGATAKSASKASGAASKGKSATKAKDKVTAKKDPASKKSAREEGYHGNDKRSTREQHGYVIYRQKPGKKVEIAKVGISGRPLNKNGTSPRANSQVNKWNKAGDGYHYWARVEVSGVKGRKKILEWEKRRAKGIRERTGKKMPKHERP